MASSLLDGIPDAPSDNTDSRFDRYRPVTSRYDAAIDKYSALHGPDQKDLPALARAVMLMESQGNPNAESPAGAQGLMQVMPGTYREMGGDPSKAFDPEDNIDKGVKYLSQQLDKYKDPKLALAAYNAGPGSVDNYGGVPPFPETQNYVKTGRSYFDKLRTKSAAEKALADIPDVKPSSGSLLDGIPDNTQDGYSTQIPEKTSLALILKEMEQQDASVPPPGSENMPSLEGYRPPGILPGLNAPGPLTRGGEPTQLAQQGPSGVEPQPDPNVPPVPFVQSKTPSLYGFQPPAKPTPEQALQTLGDQQPVSSEEIGTGLLKGIAQGATAGIAQPKITDREKAGAEAGRLVGGLAPLALGPLGAEAAAGGMMSQAFLQNAKPGTDGGVSNPIETVTQTALAGVLGSLNSSGIHNIIAKMSAGAGIGGVQAFITQSVTDLANKGKIDPTDPEAVKSLVTNMLMGAAFGAHGESGGAKEIPHPSEAMTANQVEGVEPSPKFVMGPPQDTHSPMRQAATEAGVPDAQIQGLESAMQGRQFGEMVKQANPEFRVQDAAAEPTEGHQITKDQYYGGLQKIAPDAPQAAFTPHEQIIEDAIADRKPVAPGVLKDYPHLQALQEFIAKSDAYNKAAVQSDDGEVFYPDHQWQDMEDAYLRYSDLNRKNSSSSNLTPFEDKSNMEGQGSPVPAVDKETPLPGRDTTPTGTLPTRQNEDLASLNTESGVKEAIPQNLPPAETEVKPFAYMTPARFRQAQEFLSARGGKPTDLEVKAYLKDLGNNPIPKPTKNRVSSAMSLPNRMTRSEDIKAIDNLLRNGDESLKTTPIPARALPKEFDVGGMKLTQVKTRDAEAIRYKDAKGKTYDFKPDEMVHTGGVSKKEPFLDEHGTLHDEDGNPLFQKNEAPTFYSQLRKTIEQKMPNAATPEAIKGLVKGGGVKEEELKWADLDGFLNGKTKVTKQELLDHLDQNQVQVKEVTKGERAKVTKEQVALDEYDIPYEQLDGARQRYVDQLYAAGGRRENTQGNTKFQDYQEPGGKNYRELLLTLPERKGSVIAPEIPSTWKVEKYMEPNLFGDPGEHEAWRVIDTETGKDIVADHSSRSNAEDAAIGIRKGQLGAAWLRDDIASKKVNFQSSHFDEPNILAHVRFNDRTTPDGKKVLHLEEVQSDWHQEGRKKGYATKNPSPKDAKDYFGISDEAWAKFTPEDHQAYVADMIEHMRTGPKRDRGVPDAPFKKTWHEMALRRMLRYAAENGYDYLSWTGGEKQAERYDLSKQINELAYWKSGDRYEISAVDPHGKMVFDQHLIEADKLEATLGKDVAKKIVDGEGDEKSHHGFYEESGVKFLRGDNLKVGGEGMKGFYDKIIPQYLDKYGRKWGAKVQNIKAAYEGSSIRAHDQSFPAIPITDAMRKSVLEEGQPLFQGPKGQFHTEAGKAVVTFFKGKADLSTVIHEVFHAVEQGKGIITHEHRAILAADLEKLGTKNPLNSKGVFTEEAAERSARWFERYMRDGKAPFEDLKPIFAKIKAWMSEIYHSVIGSPIEKEIPPATRKVFDEWFKKVEAPKKAEATPEPKPAEAETLDKLFQKNPPKTSQEDMFGNKGRIASQGFLKGNGEDKGLEGTPLFNGPEGEAKAKAEEQQTKLFQKDDKNPADEDLAKYISHNPAEADDKSGFLSGWQKHYTDWIEGATPLFKAQQLFEKETGKPVSDEKNLKYMVDRTRGAGAIANQFIDEKLAPLYKNLSVEQTHVLDEYLIAKRSAWLYDNKEGYQDAGLSREKAQSALAKIEQRPDFSKLQERAKGIWEYNKALADAKANGGIWTREERQVFAKEPYYVPFQRDIGKAGLGGPKGFGAGAKAYTSTNKMIMRIAGTKVPLPIIEPLRAMVAQTHETASEIAKSKVWNAVVDMTEASNDLKEWIHEVPPAESGKAIEGTVSVIRNGEKKTYVVPQELADAVNNLGVTSLPDYMKALTKITQVFKRFATSWNVDFAINNLFRDQQESAINSGAIPFVNGLKGILHYLKKDEVYQQFMKMGGGQDAIESGMKASGDKAEQIRYNGARFGKAGDPQAFQDPEKLGRFMEVLKKVGEIPFDIASSVGEASEMATRLGTFESALRNNSVQKAIHIARQSTIDFSRMGNKMRQYNQVIPFLNAGVQGVDRMVRTAKDHPVAFGARFLTYGLLPMAGLLMYNKQNPNYAAIPNREKQNDWILMLGTTSPHYIKIAKSNVQQMLVNGIQMALEKHLKTAYLSGADIAGGVASAASPVSDASGFIPVPIKLLAEQMANYDLYWNKSIVKDPTLPAKYQYDPNTSETMKKIGFALNLSPARLEHLARGIMAGTAGNILFATDYALGKTGLAKTKDIQPERIPVVRRLYGVAEGWKSDLAQRQRELEGQLKGMKRQGFSDLKHRAAKESPDFLPRAMTDYNRQYMEVEGKLMAVQQAMMANSTLMTELKPMKP